MPMQPTTDRQLDRTAGRQAWSGSRLLAIGGVLFVIGLVLMIVFSGYDIGFYAGVVLATLSAPPLIAGGVLVGSAIVGKWSARRRPFA
jgi:hypothetical protein